MKRTGSILIVDNETTIADLLVELLTDAGYPTLTASDSASAFALIIDYAPALLLLDMSLPDMRGSELIAQLHGAGVGAMPIVIMSTVLADAECYVPGACTHLAKPFDIEALLTCVAQYVLPTYAEAGTAQETPQWRHER